jgi:hypothetical protein
MEIKLVDSPKFLVNGTEVEVKSRKIKSFETLFLELNRIYGDNSTIYVYETVALYSVNPITNELQLGYIIRCCNEKGE